MATYKYVIIGGGIAGQRGSQGIRKVDAEGSIALVTAEPHTPYQRPPLSKGYLRGEETLDKVYLKKEPYYAENDIEVISGVRANAVDPGARTVKLNDGRTLGYGKLLLATGGRAWRLPVPANDLPNVFTLRTIENSDAIRQAARESQRTVVVGGSFIGSEVAASLAQLGLDVTMAFLESRILERVAPVELSAWLRAKYEAHGVRILPGTTLERLQGRERAERVVIRDHESHVRDIDMVVMGVGIRLNTELAQGAGLEMKDNAILVDGYLRTSDPHIYAAGDIASWPDPTFGRRLRVEHWDVARRQGLRAGGNMAGDLKPYMALPYFFSDLFDLSFEVWGDLSTWDQTVLRGSLDVGSFAFYYFQEGSMVGVLAAGRPDEERKPMQALVHARPAHDDVAARLRDEGVDLADMVD